jgi:hypothetical protein
MHGPSFDTIAGHAARMSEASHHVRHQLKGIRVIVRDNDPERVKR